ncbi:uncharacterized protein BXZ73DRAFT_52732 [Epithele typhae]|uniref:uncharacterized protein n=1 Tax=Epithele typhae TaxID=378194 RepID=UPI002007AF76|nr:uncharacterized protein BXZ73DRAFT_52732 [Epithele typhae]KAH9918932.1 hypothetical protein BXZ73DRAFT_52732 [Epithele typhae]
MIRSRVHRESVALSAIFLCSYPRCSRRISRLNDDVLLVLIQMLRDDSLRTLKSFSQTCKYLRALAVPVLFSRCRTGIRTPDNEQWRVPRAVFPFIRHVTLHCLCPDADAVQHGRPQWATNVWLCGVLDPPPFFKDGLMHMPHWSSITIKKNMCHRHGVPWTALHAILSVPALRKLRVHGILFAPRRLTPSELFSPASIAPLTSFTYTFGNLLSFDDLPAPSELEALSAVLEAVCGTLEYLELTAASAPLDTLERLRWPRLHTLKIPGRRPQPQLRSYASLFSNMPHLRVLGLELHVKEPLVGLAVPSPSSSPSFPWPELEHLFLPLPLPEDDPMYSQLPSSLHTLSVLCYPHYAQRDEYHVGSCDIKPPRPTSQALETILGQCLASARLTRLEIEYAVPRRPGEDLLGLVVNACPLLEELKLFRYRPDLEPDDPIGASTRAWKPPHELAVRPPPPLSDLSQC